MIDINYADALSAGGYHPHASTRARGPPSR